MRIVYEFAPGSRPSARVSPRCASRACARGSTTRSPPSPRPPSADCAPRRFPAMDTAPRPRHRQRQRFLSHRRGGRALVAGRSRRETVLRRGHRPCELPRPFLREAGLRALQPQRAGPLRQRGGLGRQRHRAAQGLGIQRASRRAQPLAPTPRPAPHAVRLARLRLCPPRVDVRTDPLDGLSRRLQPALGAPLPLRRARD